MTTELLKWAVTERTFIQNDIKWFEAGAKLISPSREDLTLKKLSELKARLEHANKVIAEQDANRT